ncbi:secretory calcium-binding phosphoprotein proline-glutamine rich 1 [Lycaon pictus]
MKFLILAGLLSTATALPIPLEQYGGGSSEQRFGFYPPQGPPFFPQILFPPPPQLPLIPIPLPFPFDPNQVLTLNDLITVNISALLIY